MHRGVATIWIGMLVATVFGVVPAVVALLHRAFNAARRIEQYTDEMLTGGVGVANNTAHVAALKDTISAAPLLIGAAGELEHHTAMIEDALVHTASADGHSPAPEEV